MLLDDTLSALDTKVSSSIFKNLKSMAKKGHTIILVTHNI